MKTQIDFARETRNLEKQSVKIEKEFLAFVAEKLQSADLTTAEKYTVLTAFVEEFATGGSAIAMNIFEHSGSDKTATKLADVMHNYDLEFRLEEKREEIAEAMRKNDAEYRAWNEANSPKSPLLPN